MPQLEKVVLFVEVPLFFLDLQVLTAYLSKLDFSVQPFKIIQLQRRIGWDEPEPTILAEERLKIIPS